jgi:transposase
VFQRKLKALNGQVELFFLPPYSPEINPDEVVWSHVKRQIGRSVVTTKDDLRHRLMSALHSLQKMPTKIMAVFQHPECRSAAI